MIRIKTKKDIELLREGGKRLAHILKMVAQEVKPGVSTHYLNQYAETLIKEGGDTSAFFHYKPKGAIRPYPASLCVSINDEIVHGIPNESPRDLEEGDIVSLDLGLIHHKLITDHAITLGVGKIDSKTQELIEVTKKALYEGIKQARPGKKTGDIGYAIQQCAVPYKLGIIEELSGHGVGYDVHEEPYVPNYGVPAQGALLKPGMVIAIEPMFTLGGPEIELDHDGYTYRTADGTRAAHFEHTVLITDGDSEILTI